QLECLMSTRPESRKAAFGGLLDYLQNVRDSNLLLRLDIYSRQCQEWLRMNNALPTDGSPSWCQLLSPQEQKAWADGEARADQAKGEDFA
ncbi:MAG: hypothetical protein WA056_08670, partial [Gallionella sp.]